MVMSEAKGSSQKSLDKAILRLKERAAELGANGLILGGTKVHKVQPTYYGIPIGGAIGSETGVSGKAIYVP